MKKVKIFIDLFIFISLTLLITYKINCQTICYTYDINGNRIKSEICLIKLSEVDSSDEKIIRKKDTVIKNKNSLNLLEDIFVFPNPTNKLITIYFSNNTIKKCVQLLIYSLAGKILLKDQTCLQKNDMDLSSLSPGTYILIIKCEQNVQKWKIIVNPE